MRLFGRLHAEFGLRHDSESQRSEQRAEFAQLAGVG
jgi:hypothetical protein